MTDLTSMLAVAAFVLASIALVVAAYAAGRPSVTQHITPALPLPLEPGERYRTVIVSDRVLTDAEYQRLRVELEIAGSTDKPMILEGGLRLERWPWPKGGPDLRSADDVVEGGKKTAYTVGANGDGNASSGSAS